MTTDHPAIHKTTFIDAPRLSNELAINVTLASETFQRTGSFKFRAAYNVATSVPHSRIIAASSGNFGQALACACAMVGKECIVVMPTNAARVKVTAVREYGGHVDLVDTTKVSRKQRVMDLAEEYPDAYIASAFDDLLVIAGNATLGHELAECGRAFDYVIAPIGGGGLTSGIVQGLRERGCGTRVVAAEPLMANDAACSFRAGRIIANEAEPQTIADGARTLAIGEHNWAVLKSGFDRVIEVPEEAILQGVRMLFTHANLKAEPTGALGLGALLCANPRFHRRSVCCVVSGGNVDASAYRAMISD